MRGLSLLDVAFVAKATPPLSTDWSTRVVANGGALPSAGTIAAMETFRLGMISAGLDTKMHSLCVFVPDSLIAATTPLFVGIGSDPWTNNNFVGGDLTVDGLKGNTTTKYLDTGVMAKAGEAVDSGTGNVGLTILITETDGNAVGVNIGQLDSGINSKRLMLFVAGYYTASGQTYFSTRNDSSRVLYPEFNRCGYVSANSVSGILDVYEASPTMAHRTAYGGYASVTTPTTSNQTIYAFCSNSNGTAATFRAERMSFVAIHDGLTSAESSNLWGLLNTLRASLGGGTGDEVDNWSARVISNGGAALSGATVTAVRAFLSGLETDSLLSKMVAVNCLVPDNLTAASMPVISNYGLEQWVNHNFVGGDLTTTGLKGAATKYFETGMIPSMIPTTVPAYSSTSAGITTVVSDVTGATAGGYIFGTVSGVFASHYALIPIAAPTSSVQCYQWGYGNANDQILAAKPSPGATWLGYLGLNRTGASAMSLYAASTVDAHASIGSVSGAQSGSALATSMYFMALNNFGTANGFVGHSISFAAVHAGLTSGESLNFYNRIATLRTALGGGNP